MDNTHKVLAILMRDQGLNQVKLAQATGLKQSTISRILNPGAVNGIKLPSDAQVRPVAAFFGVSTDQMRGYEAIQEPKVPSSVSAVSQEDVLLQQLRRIESPQIMESITQLVRLFANGQISPLSAHLIEQYAASFSTSSIIEKPEVSKAAAQDKGANVSGL